MKKTFLFKAVDAAMWVFTIFGASAFLLTVLALCGVPMGWQIGVCSVLPGCLIIQGLVAIFRHELRKMKRSFIDHHVAELKKLLKEMESDVQEEECRFHEGGKCTFGDGLPECAKEQSCGGGTPITVFDREYPMDVQAEGMAVQLAVATGACDKCEFLRECSSNENFVFPKTAWCSKKKGEILDDLLNRRGNSRNGC